LGDAQGYHAVLILFLQNPEIYVREAVLYGLARHIGIPSVKEAISKVSTNDASEEIRALAKELLEEHPSIISRQ
jgi:hypothetical protein